MLELFSFYDLANITYNDTIYVTIDESWLENSTTRTEAIPNDCYSPAFHSGGYRDRYSMYKRLVMHGHDRCYNTTKSGPLTPYVSKSDIITIVSRPRNHSNPLYGDRILIRNRECIFFIRIGSNLFSSH